MKTTLTCRRDKSRAASTAFSGGDAAGAAHKIRRNVAGIEGLRCFGGVAVLFSDIMGFTGIAEGQPADATFDILRRYYSRMGTVVSAHGGRVVQFSGDAVVATFGGCNATHADATNALACGCGILATIDRWNSKRRARQRFTFKVGVGIHVGDVAFGEVGVDGRRTKTIAGDTVNVARKLEALTRKLPTSLVVSCSVVEAVRREAVDGRYIMPLIEYGHYRIPGCTRPIGIWGLDPLVPAVGWH